LLIAKTAITMIVAFAIVEQNHVLLQRKWEDSFILEEHLVLEKQSSGENK